MKNNDKNRTCITCLDKTKRFYEIDHGRPMILEKLLLCLPFLNLESVTAPVLCFNCYKLLNSAFILIKKYLHKNKKLREYQVNYRPSSNKIEINNVFNESKFKNEMAELEETERLNINQVENMCEDYSINEMNKIIGSTKTSPPATNLSICDIPKVPNGFLKSMRLNVKSQVARHRLNCKERLRQIPSRISTDTNQVNAKLIKFKQSPAKFRSIYPPSKNKALGRARKTISKSSIESSKQLPRGIKPKTSMPSKNYRISVSPTKTSVPKKKFNVQIEPQPSFISVEEFETFYQSKRIDGK